MHINKDTWLLEKLDGKWRFIDHENKLLTYGWFDLDDVDLGIVSLKPYMIEDYKLNYLEYF